MIVMTYRDAIKAGLRETLLENPTAFLMGEDVGSYGGCYAVSKGMLAEFGKERILDTPLSEAAFVGAAIGAAIAGLRPIVEIMTVNFSLLALDQIVNNAATLRHMSGGQIDVPLIVRMATGAGRQLAAQHSHSWEGWYAHIPGLTIVTPATIDDARWMLQAAIKQTDPVLIFEHVGLYGESGELDDGKTGVSLTGAMTRKEGRDITIVTYGGSLHKAMEAAKQLQNIDISAEVIDLRCLRPLDDQTIMKSIRKTSRVLIIDEGWRSGGIAGEIMARIMEQAFYDLDAPVTRICSAEVPIPYPKHLEDAALPQTNSIVSAAKTLVMRHE